MSRKQTDLEDIHPRSHPEDRQEGSFNPDPNLEGWTGAPADAEPAGGGSTATAPARAIHSPEGEAGDDDGAGNPSPRPEEGGYGQEDADQSDLGAT
jgi:hypothetical protein